jgi:hypothetical protein
MYHWAVSRRLTATPLPVEPAGAGEDPVHAGTREGGAAISRKLNVGRKRLRVFPSVIVTPRQSGAQAVPRKCVACSAAGGLSFPYETDDALTLC